MSDTNYIFTEAQYAGGSHATITETDNYEALEDAINGARDLANERQVPVVVYRRIDRDELGIVYPDTKEDSE